MGIPRLLDHIVIAGPHLGELVDWFAERSGVTAAPGGVHAIGSANALVALSVDGARRPSYIELIGPDPARDVVPDVFGIPALKEPRVVTYAVRPEDIDEVVAGARTRGHDPGDVHAMSRRTPEGTLLEWRLTRLDGADWRVPFLIDWGATPHPGLGDLPAVELRSFVRAEPDPEPLRRVLARLGLAEDALADVVEGDPAGYRVEIADAHGVVTSL